MFIYESVRCLRVVDGDTIDCAILLTPDSLTIKKRIRLARIDTPEMHQVGGKEAKKIVMEKIQNSKIDLHIFKLDSFGRWIGEVYKDGENISDWLLENGIAKPYVKPTPLNKEGSL